jgi:hypothetical protein
MRRKITRRAFCAAVAALAAGCGARRFDVAGKVSYNGGALGRPEGHVVFVGPNGEQAEAAINLDGTYRVAGAAAGINRVAVYYLNPKAKKEKGSKLKPGEHRPVSEPLFLTPEKYASPDTSGLSVVVDKETAYDIPLTGPAIH